MRQGPGSKEGAVGRGQRRKGRGQRKGQLAGVKGEARQGPGSKLVGVEGVGV